MESRIPNDTRATWQLPSISSAGDQRNVEQDPVNPNPNPNPNHNPNPNPPGASLFLDLTDQQNVMESWLQHHRETFPPDRPDIPLPDPLNDITLEDRENISSIADLSKAFHLANLGVSSGIRGLI